MKNNLAIACCLFVLLTACTLAPKDIGRAYMFALMPVETAGPAPAASWGLTVALPVAAPELDTYRIALRRDARRWDYYAGVRWSEFLPVLVQDNITKTLENAHLFRNVTTDQAGVKGEQLLKLAIRDFQAEYKQGHGAPLVKIKLVASLINRSEGAIISSFEIKAEAHAAKEGLPAIQAAFAAAFSAVQKQLVDKLSGRL